MVVYSQSCFQLSYTRSNIEIWYDVSDVRKHLQMHTRIFFKTLSQFYSYSLEVHNHNKSVLSYMYEGIIQNDRLNTCKIFVQNSPKIDFDSIKKKRHFLNLQ